MVIGMDGISRFAEDTTISGPSPNYTYGKTASTTAS